MTTSHNTITLLLCSMFLAACTVPRPIDDRLTYGTQRLLEEQGAPGVEIAIDPSTRAFVFEAGADGFVGGMCCSAFPIGTALSAYLEQATRLQPQPRLPVNVRLVAFEMHYTNSGWSAAGAGRLFVDWVSMKVSLETTYPDRQVLRHNYHKEVDLPVEETSVIRDDRAVQIALEDILLQFLHDVKGHLKNSPNLPPQ